MKVMGLTAARFGHLLRSALQASWEQGLPYKGTLAVTFRCPCRCRHCGIWQRDPGPELPTGTLLAALASVPELAWLDITGGEIFLRSDYRELCLGIVKTLPRLALFHFPTTGDDPDAAVALARDLAATGVRVVVSVSVDGPPTLHDELRGRPGLFVRALETFSRLRELHGVDAYLGVTLVPENVALVPRPLFDALRNHLSDLRPTDIHVNVMQRSDHYFRNREAPVPPRNDVAEALARVMSWKGLPTDPFSGLEWAFQRVARKVLLEGPAAAPQCGSLASSFYMGPDGTVYPCHIWGEPVGQVSADRTLRDVLESPAARYLRGEVRRRHCPGCWTPCEAYPSIAAHLLNPLQRVR